ncbi:MAG: aspartate kinase, partial [Promethearchaeota archaeon]
MQVHENNDTDNDNNLKIRADNRRKSSHKQLFIFKFGGSCLKNKFALQNAIEIIKNYIKRGRIVVVTSAFYGVTNQLLEWIQLCEDSANMEAPLNFLGEIKNKHFDIIQDLFKENTDLKSNCIDYVNKRFEELENIGKIVLKDSVSDKNRDLILSYGERLSTFIFSAFLKKHGYKSEFFSSDDGLIITNDNFGNALPILPKIEQTVPSKLMKFIEEGSIPVVSGYYAISEKKNVTTLGRGGTDFSATIIAYALADLFKVKVIFWKDVFGILSANPKFVPKAKVLKHLSFSEAKQLAFFGGKVLHPLCLITTEKKNIEVEIRNYNEPFSNISTIISHALIEEHSVIKAITTIEDVSMITVEGESMIALPGVAAKIFSIIGDNNINIKFISQSSSENNITFGVDRMNGFKASQLLATSSFFGKYWLKVKSEHDVSLIAVIGEGMARKSGIAGKVFTTL